MTQRPVPQDSRVPMVDLVRFLSVVLIISYHYFCSSISLTGYPPLEGKAIVRLFPNSYYGVTFFFVVSGFIISGILMGSKEPLSKIDLKSFYIRRAARLFPLLALSIAVGLFCVVAFSPPIDSKMSCCFKKLGFHFTPGFWLSLGTFQFNWFLLRENPAAPPAFHWRILWTLAIEEQFYFFYPFLIRSLGERTKILRCLLGIIVLGMVFREWAHLQFPGNVFWGYNASFSNFDQIAIGCVAYLTLEGLRAKAPLKPWIPAMFLWTGLLTTASVYLFTSPILSDRVWQPTVISLGCALVLLGGSLSPFLNGSFFSFLAWPGRLGYGCYIWQALGMFILWDVLVRVGHLRALGLYVGGVFLIALASYYFFERPANRWIRGRFRLPPSATL